LGDVEADDAPRGSDGASEFNGGGAASATDVDYRGSAAGSGECEQGSSNRSERTIEAILLANPEFAVFAVPALALSFVELLCGGYG